MHGCATLTDGPRYSIRRDHPVEPGETPRPLPRFADIAGRCHVSIVSTATLRRGHLARRH
ncbi:hypothetical protein BCEP4_220074 [Burkholderia cepacia]|nr:hypothetical protein BCEP4_220074 [Burkholderia cepacia]